MRFTSNFLTLAFLTLVFASAGAALPARTWVASNGADGNPCSRSSPCATFAGAFSKTAPGGEINCVDSGDFGLLTITKAITIDCAGNLGSILVTGSSDIAIDVQAGPNDVVTIRNLSINGKLTGGTGIHSRSAKALHIENVQITGFLFPCIEAISSVNGQQLTVENATISECSSGISTRGETNAATVIVDIHNTRIFNTLGAGVFASNGSRVTIHDSNIYRNRVAVQEFIDTGIGGQPNAITVAVINSTLGYSSTAAIQSSAFGAFLLAFGNSFINDVVAFDPHGGSIFTGSDNVNSGSNPGTANGGTAPKI